MGYVPPADAVADAVAVADADADADAVTWLCLN
jgi:hypothetical protein